MLNFLKGVVQTIKRNTDYLIGKATSSPTSNSMAQRIETLQYTTNLDTLYPALADGVSINTDHTWGTASGYTEVVPVNTITTAFIIVGIIATGPDIGGANRVKWVIRIGSGAGGSESLIASVGGYVDDAFVNTSNVGIMLLPKPVYVAANTRIAAHCSHAAGVTTTNALVSIVYYALPLV